MVKADKSKPAKPSGRRLKVFQAAFGFYDTVVAAPNQGEALKAWGVRQNLFAEGAARVVDDQEAVEAALAHPGAPLRRPIGSKDSFRLDPARPAMPAAKSKPARHETPDRTALSAAEAALRGARRNQAEEAADLAQRRKDLDTAERQAKTRWVRAEDDARRAIAKARRAFARAGGDPDA